MYFTEYSGGGWNQNYADVLKTETRLIFIGQTKSWAKNVLLWNLALDEHHGPKVKFDIYIHFFNLESI